MDPGKSWAAKWCHIGKGILCTVFQVCGITMVFCDPLLREETGGNCPWVITSTPIHHGSSKVCTEWQMHMIVYILVPNSLFHEVLHTNQSNHVVATTSNNGQTV